MTAHELTRLHTVLAVAWLWHRQGSRVLATEVGVGKTGDRLMPAMGAWWRADVVGVSGGPGKPHCFDVVEVKGHRADFRRDQPRDFSKWSVSDKSPLRLWLLVSAEVTDEDLVGVPGHWGLLRATAERDQVQTLRKPAGAGILESKAEAASLYACGTRAISGWLPRLGRGVPDSTKAILAAGLV